MNDDSMIRTYQTEDHAAVAHLYQHGLLSGQHDSNDTAADIDHMVEAYFASDKDHFWVAVVADEVVGCVGVVHDEAMAQIRRLRIAADHRNSPLPALLLSTALKHCRQHGFLKVVLDTHLNPAKAMELIKKSGFQFARNKQVQGREVLEFYYNLYHKVDPRQDVVSQAAAATFPPPLPPHPPAPTPPTSPSAVSSAHPASNGHDQAAPATGSSAQSRADSPEPRGAPADEWQNGSVRVILADDHEILRTTLVKLFAAEAGIDVVGEASDGEQAVELTRQVKPDVVVMDVNMPRRNGVEATRAILGELPGTRVIGLSMYEKQEIARLMLEAGASAYLPKDAPPQMLINALHD